MDATASREPTWDTACQIQGEMFSQTAKMGGLDVQLAYYRGYKDFRATPWISTSADLIPYMTKVRCLGGHTQVERLLRYAVKETAKQKINALVFVGDCLEEDVDQVCAVAGELGIMGVPCFLFHEGQEPIASRAFQQIATNPKKPQKIRFFAITPPIIICPNIPTSHPRRKATLIDNHCTHVFGDSKG